MEHQPPTLQQFLDRLDDGEARLVALATRPFPAGLTDPDAGGEERWDAAQVWAHLAEFPAYWVGEARKILATSADGPPPPFGRTATDAGRIAAIERDRFLLPDELWQRVHSGIGTARAYATGLSPDEWQRLGEHPRRGPVPVGFVLDQFVAGHLGEHATQLEKLAG
jgi:hypothetical protein